MILQELTGIKSGHVDNTFDGHIQDIADRHNIDIRSGLQARVLLLPEKSYVYRVWIDDTGFERWLKYCETHHSPHLPKILSKVRSLDATFLRLPKNLKPKVVKLEKLRELDDQELITALNVFSQLHIRLRRSELKELSIEKLIDVMSSVPDDRYYEPTAKTGKTVEKYASFFRLCLSLALEANDINPQNVLMRGSTPVLMDPFSD